MTALGSSQDTAGISLPSVITRPCQTPQSCFVLCALTGDVACTISSAENWVLLETLMHVIGTCFSGVFLSPFKDRGSQISPPLIKEMLKASSGEFQASLEMVLSLHFLRQQGNVGLGLSQCLFWVPWWEKHFTLVLCGWSLPPLLGNSGYLCHSCSCWYFTWSVPSKHKTEASYPGPASNFHKGKVKSLSFLPLGHSTD